MSLRGDTFGNDLSSGHSKLQDACGLHRNSLK